MPAIVLYVVTTLALITLWSRSIRRVRLTTALVLALLPLCFTGQALLTGRVYAPIDRPYASEPLADYARDRGIGRHHNAGLSDLYMQMIPWQHTVREQLRRGEWPLWNPHLLAGTVLAANMQSAVYDPLHLAALVLAHPQALTFDAAMTFFIAAFFTWAFARAVSLGEVASLVAAAAYAFCAPLAFFVGWPLGRAWALLPFVLLGTRLVVRETNARAVVSLTAALVLTVVAGHPETVLHVVSIAAVHGGVETLVTRRYRAIAPAVLSGVVALLLTAVVLLPFLEAAPRTWQHAIRAQHYAVHPLPVAPGAIAQRALVSVFPWYGGQPERGASPGWDPTNVRVGSVVLALAAAALLLAPRRRLTWWAAALAVVGVLGGLNAWPVAAWLHALPAFDVALNERLVFAAAFAMAMLAAVAVDAWPSATKRARAGAALTAAVGLVLALGTVTLRRAQMAAGVDAALIATLALAELLPLAVLAGLLAAGTRARVAAPLVLGLVLLQRTAEDGTIYPALPASAFYPPVPILEHMQRDRGEPFRMVGLHYAFLPDAAALYGLDDARGYEAMTFRPLVETYPLWCRQLDAWFNNVHDRSRPFLSFLNVKYAIGSRRLDPDDRWKLVVEDRESRLFENTRVLPRAWVPARIRYEAEPKRVLEAMSAARDFSVLAWITTPREAPREVANGPGRVEIRRAGTAFDLAVTMDDTGWLVISESGWPGWRAAIDGRPAELHAANHAFLGVHVPKGQHRVTLVYRPRSFVLGRATSLATAGALLIVIAVRRLRR